MSNYAIETFTTKTNKVDLVDAAHINAVQTSIVTIETALNILISQNGSIAQGSSFPGSPVSGQIFYRTDLRALYIYTGSAWQSAQNLSNVLFQYQGCIDLQGVKYGETQETTLSPTTPSGKYRFLFCDANASGGSPALVWSTKYRHIAGIANVVTYGRLWGDTESGSPNAKLTMSIGGLTGFFNIGSGVTTPTWGSVTIDVSSLTPGTVYDVTATLDDSGGSGGSNLNRIFCANIVGFGT